MGSRKKYYPVYLIAESNEQVIVHCYAEYYVSDEFELPDLWSDPIKCFTQKNLVPVGTMDYTVSGETITFSDFVDEEQSFTFEEMKGLEYIYMDVELKDYPYWYYSTDLTISKEGYYIKIPNRAEFPSVKDKPTWRYYKVREEYEPLCKILVETASRPWEN